MTELEIRACWACICGLFDECMNPTPCEDAPGFFIPCAFVNGGPAEDPAFKVANPVGRPMKDPNDVTDPTSTGRKRAAMVAPIFDGMMCEWAGLKFAGGGVIPIVGCGGNLISETKGKGQGDRHHGPDKNVLNNAVGTNLHRVCMVCHHRWHELNDPFYSVRPAAGQVFIPTSDYYAHDSITEADLDEQEESEEYWSLPVAQREGYPFSPSTSTKMLPGLATSEESATLTEILS